MMELVNALYVYKEAQKNYNAGLVYETVSALLRLLAPFVPHVTEELWHGVIELTAACMHKAGLKPRQSHEGR